MSALEMLARLRRDDGMSRSAGAAGNLWAEQAYRMVRAYLREHEFFHVDEFWTWAMDRGLSPGTQPKAIGAVIQRARSDGLMRKTRIGMASVRSNMTAKPVWRSETYQGVRTGLFRGEVIPR